MLNNFQIELKQKYSRKQQTRKWVGFVVTLHRTPEKQPFSSYPSAARRIFWIIRLNTRVYKRRNAWLAKCWLK